MRSNHSVEQAMNSTATQTARLRKKSGHRRANQLGMVGGLCFVRKFAFYSWEKQNSATVCAARDGLRSYQQSFWIELYKRYGCTVYIIYHTAASQHTPGARYDRYIRCAQNCHIWLTPRQNCHILLTSLKSTQQPVARASRHHTATPSLQRWALKCFFDITAVFIFFKYIYIYVTALTNTTTAAAEYWCTLK